MSFLIAASLFGQTVPGYRPAVSDQSLLAVAKLANSDKVVLKTPEQSIQYLCERHAHMMAGRPDHAHGVFKTDPNRAGNSLFVHPRHVRGTLSEGFAMCRTLPSAFARAVFMKFLVSEVHPFADGNGRIARVMMNAELVSAGEQRIIIPTVFRTEYLSALKALTHNQRSEPLLNVLAYAQRYTHQIDFASLETARKQLTATNAFEPPADALGVGEKLILPASLSR